jgi:hypothetical protein
MQNGDRYFGTVLSLNSDTLTLKNEFLGTIRLPRGKVSVVMFGANTGTNVLGAPLLTNSAVVVRGWGRTNSPPTMALQLRQLGTQTNLIRQVESQFLAGAGPEAKDKFNELLGGLMSGQLGVDDIRVEAQSAAERLRAAKKDLGEDAGPLLDSYLAILDSFVKETAPPNGSANSPKGSPKPKPAAGLADED